LERPSSKPDLKVLVLESLAQREALFVPEALKAVGWESYASRNSALVLFLLQETERCQRMESCASQGFL
jgi:hypothetical protein